METSDSIAKLAEALSKAQAVIEGAKKSADNPYFKSKYADLSEVWDACRKPLTDNGLSVVQTAEFIPEHPDMVCIETTLCHSSGEWMRGRLAVKPVKMDPQGVGSCVTYLRRYSLQSIVGIAPEDDDGNAASGQSGQTQSTPKPTLSPATEGQITAIYAAFNGAGIKDKAMILDEIKKITGKTITSSKELTKDDAGKVLTHLSQKEKVA